MALTRRPPNESRIRIRLRRTPPQARAGARGLCGLPPLPLPRRRRLVGLSVRPFVVASFQAPGTVGTVGTVAVVSMDDIDRCVSVLYIGGHASVLQALRKLGAGPSRVRDNRHKPMEADAVHRPQTQPHGSPRPQRPPRLPSTGRHRQPHARDAPAKRSHVSCRLSPAPTSAPAVTTLSHLSFMGTNKKSLVKMSSLLQRLIAWKRFTSDCCWMALTELQARRRGHRDG